MKSTYFFNSLKAVACSLLLLVSAAHASFDDYGVTRGDVAYWNNALYAPNNPVVMPEMSSSEQMVAPMTQQVPNWTARAASYVADKYNQFSNYAGKSAMTAAQWAKDNPKISIPLGALMVGGAVAGTYVSIRAYMSPQQRETADAYIALNNGFLKAIEELVRFKQIREQIAKLGVSKSGLIKKHPNIERAFKEINNLIMDEFNKAVAKHEHGVKLSPAYLDIKKNMKTCLSTYVNNTTGNSEELIQRGSELSSQVAVKLNDLSVELKPNSSAVNEAEAAAVAAAKGMSIK